MKFWKVCKGILPTVAFFGINVFVSIVAIVGYIVITIAKGSSMNAIMGMDSASLMKAIIAPSTLGFQILGTIALGLWYYFKFYRKKKPDNVNFLKGNFGILAVALILGMICAIDLFFNAVDLLIPKAMENYNNYIESVGIGSDSVLMMICTIIMAPIVEELCFRALTIRYLREAGLKKVWIIVIQAALFGIVHGTPLQMIYAFALGIFLGLIFYKYDSVFPTMLLHFLFNVYGGYVTGKVTQLFYDYLPVWAEVLIYVIGTAIGLFVAIYLLRKGKDREAMPCMTKPEAVPVSEVYEEKTEQ